MLSFTKKDLALFHKLNTPAKVQDFLNTIPINFEKDKKDTIKSPVMVLRKWNAHCIEGAILGAYILSLHGHKPLLINLKCTKVNGNWGALSKTNHVVQRYREPVYKNIHELMMSYFHEYYLENGQKTLRAYSEPLNLNTFEKNWSMEENDLWGIESELDKIKYYKIAPKNIRNLRLADKLEREVLKLTEWKK